MLCFAHVISDRCIVNANIACIRFRDTLDIFVITINWCLFFLMNILSSNYGAPLD